MPRAGRSHPPKAKSPARPAVPTSPLAWADRAPAGTGPAILLLFLAVITPVLLFLHPVGDYFVETDFYGGYAPGVHALWAHGPDPARYGVVGPVYELVLGLLGRSGIDLFRLAQFLSLAATLVTLTLWWRWTDRRFGRGAGWIAVLLAATNPTIVRYAYTAGTDALYVALFSASCVALFAVRPTVKHALLAGFLAAAATLTRYTGIVLVPLGLLVMLGPWKGGGWRDRRFASAGLFLLGVLALFGPWWAFTLAKGAPPSLRFYHNLAYEVYARSRGITWDNYQISLEKDFPTWQSVFTREPGAVWTRIGINLYEHLGQIANELLLVPFAILAALGAAGWFARRVPGAGPAVAVAGVVYLSLVPVFFASRYHMPLVPAAAALAAAFLAAPTLLGAWFARLRIPSLGAILVAGVAAFTVVFAVRATVRETQDIATQVPNEVPQLGRALKADWKGPGRPTVMARKPHLSYYADAVPIPFEPLDSLESLARYVHERKVDYLYISWPEALLRPPFAFLLVPEFAPPGLELVSTGAEGHAVLYRVTPEFGREMPAWYPREWEWRAGEGMTRIQPNDPTFWLAAGEGRHARKDYPGAHEAFDMALRLHPGWGRAYYDLGNLLAEQGDFAGAVQAYQAALAGGEKNPLVWRNLGVALAQTGEFARAKEAITRYIGLSGDHAFDPMLAELDARMSAPSR